MTKPEHEENPQESLNLLTDIKKLLILSLLKNGSTTEEVGTILGVSYKTIERLVPRKKAK